MNKYYINCCTGDKAVVEEQKSYLMHIEELNKPTRTGGISEENLHKFWIPVTKAEYESSLTLEEIKRNRNEDKLKEVNSQFVEQYNTSKTDLKQMKKDILGKEVKCLHEIENLAKENIHIGDILIITGCFNDDTVCLKADDAHYNNEFIMSYDTLKENFEFVKGIKVEKYKETTDDKVNHPSHYTWLKDLCGIEVIDITRHLDFDCGNAVKYLLRAGHKKEKGYTNKDKTIEDLKKAIFYINDEIKLLQNG